MFSDFAIRAKNLSKLYQIYDQPLDRLKQSFWRTRKKFYREFWALKNFSFDIRKGETLGIIGSNGSGKSTLLQLICGTLNPTEGEIEINGRVSALLELGAGFNPEFTGRENIYMNAAIMGLSHEETEKRYHDILEFANIGDFIERPVKTYSSGMYVRLAFAIAVNVAADILLVDEALAVGDVRFQQKCMAKIKEFCQNGTVIFVSHDSLAITELCSRVFWIENGDIRMDDAPKYVVEKYLQYMYEGDIKPQQIPAKNTETDNDTPAMTGFAAIDKNIRQFGDGRAAIEGVRFCCEDVSNVMAYSGKPCKIELILQANENVGRPVIGYVIKDRLGREILGDNTALMQYRISPFVPGKKYMVTFQIASWPNLCEGDYALSFAVADGEFDDHVQCHWLHDAIVIKSMPVRPPGGMFSMTDTHISFIEL